MPGLAQMGAGLIYQGASLLLQKWKTSRVDAPASTENPLTQPMPEFPRLEAPGSMPAPWIGIAPPFNIASVRDIMLPETATGTPGATVGWSYSDQVAAGIACANCTRKHLATMHTALDAAAKASQDGDAAGVRYAVARAKAEGLTLMQYDWHPAKVAATPPDLLPPIQAVMDPTHRLVAALPTPDAVALAWGSVDEAVSFARSTPQKDRDRGEIEERMMVAEAQLVRVERIDLAPENAADRTTAGQACDALRQARHVLDQGSVYDASTLEAASAHLAAAAVILTPAPDSHQANAWAAQARGLYRQFYAGYLAYLQTRKEPPSP